MNTCWAPLSRDTHTINKKNPEQSGPGWKYFYNFEIFNLGLFHAVFEYRMDAFFLQTEAINRVDIIIFCHVFLIIY